MLGTDDAPWSSIKALSTPLLYRDFYLAVYADMGAGPGQPVGGVYHNASFVAIASANRCVYLCMILL